MDGEVVEDGDLAGLAIDIDDDRMGSVGIGEADIDLSAAVGAVIEASIERG